jgi:molybdenum cofactor biosynthesis protein B
VGCFVLTVSDTRTEATDTGGQAIRDLLESAGHVVTGRAIVRDDPAAVAGAVTQQLSDARTHVIVTTGGTGITSRDGTFEAIDRLFEKRLTGFGELFRMLSFEQIGAAAMMSRACAGIAAGHIVISLPGSEAAVRLAMNSRATAGTAAGKAIFVLPGSPDAVRLAMTRLIIPELGHVVQQVSR